MRLLLLVFVLTLPLQAAAQPKPLPMGAGMNPGVAAFQASGNTLTITSTPGAIINWQSFSIGTGAAKFNQPQGSTAVLNRVPSNQTPVTGVLQANPAGPGAPSGALPVAPHVYIVSPSGMAGSQAIGLQIPVRPASANAAAILPDGRVVFRASPP